MAVGVWARLGAENQTQKRLDQALLIQHNQTTALGPSQLGHGWPGPGSPARPARCKKSNTPLVAVRWPDRMAVRWPDRMAVFFQVTWRDERPENDIEIVF